jgi:hypothetical protein
VLEEFQKRKNESEEAITQFPECVSGGKPSVYCTIYEEKIKAYSLISSFRFILEEIFNKVPI